MSNDVKLIRVRVNTHVLLEKLGRILAQEKGLRKVPLTDAAEIAIQEALARRLPEPRKPEKVV